jgi:uncharacterized protein (TIGR03435 family)
MTSILAGGLVQAQAPSAVSPTFDAASIKVNRSAETGGGFGVRGGQLSVRNYTLFSIVRNAYMLQPYQIVGGPEWINTDRFDIVARPPDGVPQAQLIEMVKSLLADRFRLRVHMESRSLPIYALVMARPDGRLGPQLSRAAVDCAALQAARARGESPVIPPPAGNRPACGMNTNPGRVVAGGYEMKDVARNLAPMTGRLVVDRTGLTGAYDLELSFTPDQLPAAAPGSSAPVIDPNGPSLFTALQEQLGLKLAATTGPVDVLVIDRAEKPTED